MPNDRCSGKKIDGSPCGIRTVVETADGPRCRHHREGGTSNAGPRRVRLPVSSIRSAEDVEKLTSWEAPT